MFELIDFGYDKAWLGHRWSIRAPDGSEARIYQSDNSGKFWVTSARHNTKRCDGFLSAQIIACEMLGLIQGPT